MKIANEVNGVATNATTTNFNIEMNNKAFKAFKARVCKYEVIEEVDLSLISNYN